MKNKYKKEIEFIEKLFKPVEPNDFENLFGKSIYDIKFDFDNEEVEIEKDSYIMPSKGADICNYEEEFDTQGAVLRKDIVSEIQGKFYLLVNNDIDIEERCEKFGYNYFPEIIADKSTGFVKLKDVFKFFEPELIELKVKAF